MWGGGEGGGGREEGSVVSYQPAVLSLMQLFSPFTEMLFSLSKLGFDMLCHSKRN